MYLEGYYNYYIIVLSLLIAILASYSALSFTAKNSHTSRKTKFFWLFSASFVMGSGIWSMHFIGMKATKFYHYTGTINTNTQSVDLFLLYGVTLTVSIILLFSWGTMLLDRHALKKMAYQDSITGLPNRNEMNRFFDTLASNKRIGVLFLDLDHFKAINDTLGHDIGDLVVQEVGRRLRQFICKDQHVFRIGGDEFLFIVKNCDQKRAEHLAEQILLSVRKVYRIEGNELYITGSIGISIDSMKNSDRSTLLKTADTAMYKAKGLGKNRFCVYTAEMDTKEVRRMELEKDLRTALENRQFYLVYQPKGI